MHAQSNLNAELDVLRKIHRTAVAIIEGCNAGSHISQPTPVLDTFILPFPHDIIAPMMKLPEAEGTRKELLGCYTNRLNEFHERFLSFYRSACSNANVLDAMHSKHQPKNRSGKKTFNNVSAYGCSHVYTPNRNFRNILRYLKSISSTMHTHVFQIDWF